MALYDPKNNIHSWKNPRQSLSSQYAPSFPDTVIGNMRTSGYASANRYLVFLFPNPDVRNGLGMRFVEDISRLAITCKSVAIPETAWFTTEENFITGGASRLLPYRKNTANTAGFKLSYHCGGDMFEKEFFHDWYNYIQNPRTKQFRFYDDYAKNSEAVVLLLPKFVQNFDQAIDAYYKGLLTGFSLTEIYPYSFSVGGGTLSSASATEPLTVDVGLMFRDIMPLNNSNYIDRTVPEVSDTGFPIIERSTDMARSLDMARENLQAEVDIGNKMNNLVNRRFNQEAMERRNQFAQYLQNLDDYKNGKYPIVGDGLPKADNGLLNYNTNTGLQLGLQLLQQTQGFFGAGYFGNGFYP